MVSARLRRELSIGLIGNESSELGRWALQLSFVVPAHFALAAAIELLNVIRDEYFFHIGFYLGIASLYVLASMELTHL